MWPGIILGVYLGIFKEHLYWLAEWDTFCDMPLSSMLHGDMDH